MVTRYDDLITKATPAKPASKPGFFARLFGASDPAPEPAPAPEPVKPAVSNRYSDLVPAKPANGVAATSAPAPKATTTRYSDLVPVKAAPVEKPKKPSIFSRASTSIADSIDRPENKTNATQQPQLPTNFSSLPPEEKKKANDEFQAANKEWARQNNFLHQLPSSFVESLPFGLGAAFTQIHDVEQYAPEVGQYIDNSPTALLKEVPKATLEVGKGFIKSPISGALDVAGVFKGGARFRSDADAGIKFNIPGLGEVSNAQYRVAKRISDGEDPLKVSLEEGASGILDTLFFASLVSKPFTGRPTTTAKAEIPAADFETVPGASKGLGPKSFRLYEPKTAATPLTPEFLARAQQEGINLGENFNPDLPTYFKMSYKPSSNSFVGEVVQIRPSYFNVLKNSFGTKADPGYKYTVDSLGSSGHDFDRAIESGEYPLEKVYQGKGGALQPDFANHVVSDLSGKLDMYKPGLGAEFTKTVDLSNPTPTSLDSQALSFLNKNVAKPVFGTTIAPPQLPTPAQIAGAKPHELETLNSKEVKTKDIEEGSKTPVAPAENRYADLIPSKNVPGVNPTQDTRLTPEAAAPLAQVAADTHYEAVHAPALAAGKPTVIGADDLKDHFGNDYNDNNHPVYSKAAYTQFERALKENPEKKVYLTGGGPASGKTELIVNSLKSQGFKGIIYDSNMSNYEAAKNQIDQIKKAGKEPEIYGVLPDLDASRTFSIIRQNETGRGISEASFARGHAGFPNVAARLMADGVIDPSKVHIIDTRGIRDFKQAMDLKKRGEYLQDPLATLKELGYSEESINKNYGTKNYDKRTGKRLTKISRSDSTDKAPAQDRTNKGNADGGGNEKLLGKPKPKKGVESKKSPKIEPKKTEVQEKAPAYTGASKGAAIGSFRDGTPIELGHLEKVNPIEMPELVDIARDLMGQVPNIKKDSSMRTKNGFFKPTGKGSISLRASLFEDPEQAAKTLAHEIGHLIDYLPEGTMARGNLIGRLKSLKKFMSTTFGSERTLFGNEEGPFSAQKRKDLKNSITKDVLNKYGYKFGDLVTGNIPDADRKILQQEIRDTTKKTIDEYLAKNNYIKNADISDELKKVSQYWRPFDPEKSSASYVKYRNSSEELYADAISMLFNTPGTLEKMASTFYKEFFDALDRKPDVFNAYFDLQDILGGDKEVISEKRRAGIRKMFEDGDYKALELQRRRELEKKQRNNDLVFRLKFETVDKNQRVIDRVRQMEKKGEFVNDDDNPVYFLEERNYLGGKIKAVMEKDFNPIYRELKKEGISWDDFGEALFYDRIRAGDRSDVANPRGITPKVAGELLDKLFKDLGKYKADLLVDKMEDFRDNLKKVAEEGYKEGLYSPELYQQMQDNPAYVTFQVLDHIEEGMSSKVHKSLGTFKDITNPADASLLKMTETLKAIERNKVTKAVSKFFVKNYPGEIKEAKSVGTPKGKRFLESKLPNEDLVTYMENGKMQGYYVDPYVAKSINNETVGQNLAIIKLLSFGNSGLFRPLFIGFNLGFQSFNFVRDFLRFYKNVPGLSFVKAMSRYYQALPVAKVRAFGPKNVDIPTYGEAKALDTLHTLEKEQILSVTFNDLMSGESSEDKQIDAIFKKSGIESLNPDKPLPKIIQPLVKTLDFIKDLGDMIETIPKVAGFYHLTDGKPLTKETKSFIRKNIGSPDFLAGGHAKPATNELFLFSNAITQGIRSDYHMATEPKTRSGYWWKTAKVNLLPKILMWAAILGLFGEEVKKRMKDISEYDLTNYATVPLGTDSNGKTIYLRIPQDEGGRLIGGLFWKALHSSQDNKTVFQDLADVISFTGGNVPSFSPVVSTTQAIFQYLEGQNPYDFFRNRNVLTDDQFKAGGSYALKPFMGWLFNELGGGIFYRFTDTPPKEQSGTEKMFNLPVVGNILGRFIKVSNYGQTEKLNQIKANVQSDQAKTRIDETDVLEKYVTDAQTRKVSSGKEAQDLKTAMINEIFDGRPSGADEVEHAKALGKKFDTMIQKGKADPLINTLITAQSNEEKIALVKEIRKSMSPEEYKDFKTNAIKNKVASPEVFGKAERVFK